MNHTDFDTLFAYSDMCREQLKDVLLCHEGVFRNPFPTTSRYDTIQKLMAHSIGAEERLITARILGKSVPVTYEERAADTVEEIFTDAQAVRGVTDMFRRELNEDGYHRRIAFPLPPGSPPLELTVSDILFHILNHENFHRGQILMALQQNGIDFPNFDYILLKPTTCL